MVHSLLFSCSVPQALSISVECNARGDESEVKKGNAHHNSWQGTTWSTHEHLCSARGAAMQTKLQLKFPLRGSLWAAITGHLKI